MGVAETNLIVASVLIAVVWVVVVGFGMWLYVLYTKHQPDIHTMLALIGHKRTTLSAINSYAALMKHKDLREVSAPLAVHS